MRTETATCTTWRCASWLERLEAVRTMSGYDPPPNVTEQDAVEAVRRALTITRYFRAHAWKKALNYCAAVGLDPAVVRAEIEREGETLR